MSPFLQGGVLACQCVLDILTGDPITVRQHVHALGRGNIDHDAAGDEWRKLFDAGALPAAIA